VLSGEIGLSLRAGNVDVLHYEPCGPSSVVGQRRTLLADVQPPVPSGGQGLYRGVLHFTDNTPAHVSPTNVADYDPNDGEPHEIRLMQWFAIEAGQALSLSQEIFEEANPYAACFTFVVWDPAGHVAQTSACLPVIAPEDVAALAGSDVSVELSADDAVAADPIDAAVEAALADARRPQRASLSGCALDASPERSLPTGLALLPALLIGRRLSRARRS